MLRVSLCLRLLYLSNGLSILATAAYVAWQGGLVAFLQESSEPAAVKCLETLTIVLPCIAGILIIYTSVSSQENAFEHRQRLSWPLARCLLLLLSAWSALCLRSFDRHVNGRSWFSLGRPGELHGLAFAVILTLINAALQLRHPTGIPRVPAAAAISRQIAQRQLQGVLTIAQVDAALPPFRSLLDLLPSNEAPAIISADGSRPVLSHRELHLFIQSRVPAELAAFGVTSRDRVATVFPNGTEACVALLSVLAYATLARSMLTLRASLLPATSTATPTPSGPSNTEPTGGPPPATTAPDGDDPDPEPLPLEDGLAAETASDDGDGLLAEAIADIELLDEAHLSCRAEGMVHS